MAGFTVFRFLLLLCGLICLSVADGVLDSNGVQMRKADVNPLSINIRVERQAGGCTFPTPNPETAKWNCSKFTNKIRCQERCVWGHTLASGPIKKFRCNFKDNKWIPSPFEECKPYVNCQIRLKSPGEASCNSHQDDKEDTCTIMCFPYDEYREKPPMQYTCTTESTWVPSLPFCAEQDSTFTTAIPPSVYVFK